MSEPEIARLARNLAEQNNVDWRRLSGTGPGGLILERDVLDFLARVMAGEEALDPTPEPLPDGMDEWPEVHADSVGNYARPSSAQRSYADGADAAADAPAEEADDAALAELGEDVFLFDDDELDEEAEPAAAAFAEADAFAKADDYAESVRVADAALSVDAEEDRGGDAGEEDVLLVADEPAVAEADGAEDVFGAGWNERPGAGVLDDDVSESSFEAAPTYVGTAETTWQADPLSFDASPAEPVEEDLSDLWETGPADAGVSEAVGPSEPTAPDDGVVAEALVDDAPLWGSGGAAGAADDSGPVGDADRVADADEIPDAFAFDDAEYADVSGGVSGAASEVAAPVAEAVGWESEEFDEVHGGEVHSDEVRADEIQAHEVEVGEVEVDEVRAHEDEVEVSPVVAVEFDERGPADLPPIGAPAFEARTSGLTAAFRYGELPLARTPHLLRRNIDVSALAAAQLAAGLELNGDEPLSAVPFLLRAVAKAALDTGLVGGHVALAEVSGGVRIRRVDQAAARPFVELVSELEGPGVEEDEVSLAVVDLSGLDIDEAVLDLDVPTVTLGRFLYDSDSGDYRSTLALTGDLPIAQGARLLARVDELLASPVRLLV